MRRIKKKVSIAKYISLHFIGIACVTAIVMALFITYFSNAAIDFDVKNQIRRESRYDFVNIKLKDGKTWVSSNFVFDDNGVLKVVLDIEGNLIAGSYPIKALEGLSIAPKKVREVKVGNTHYYIYDRSIVRRDELGKAEIIAYVRSMVDAESVSSGYRTLKYTSYIYAVVVVFIAALLSSVFSYHIVDPIKQICKTSEKIGLEKDLSHRIEYNGMFREIEILAHANNRMLDRLEEMFEKQKQFSSDVTHELRTPVSVIMAQCQYAKKHIHNVEEFEEAFSIIDRQVKKTNDIISQILQLSRLDQDRVHINFEYVDLRDIVEEVCETEKINDTKNITLHLSMTKAEAWVDVGLIMVVIRNLINNAMKYSYENGEVDIALKKKDDLVEFMVRDYGCGMNEYVKKHIFDRFYRADVARNSDGFGLGLAITAKIVEIHSGTIKVESKEGKGSSFTLIFPEKI